MKDYYQNYQKTINEWAQTLSQCRAGNMQDNQAIISYAINVVFFNLLVLLVTIVPSIILGTFTTTMVALAAGGSLRIFTGGYHCLNPFHCLVITSVLFNSFGKLSTALSPIISAHTAMLLLLIVMLTTLIFIIVNAPVETPNKPIRPEKRPLLRRRGLTVWGFWMSLLLIMVFNYENYSSLILAAEMGIANQMLSISGLLRNKN